MLTFRATTAAFVVVVSIALPGCGEDQPSYCADRDALQESLSGLADVELTAGGTDALRSQLEAVDSDARARADSAQGEFGDEADGLRTDVSRLGTAAGDAVAAPSAGTLGAVGTQISEVQSAFGTLSDAVSSSC